MTDPTDPTEPTEPQAGDDPTEALVRDALDARASSVHPTQDDPAHLEAAIEADRRARTRRRTAFAGLGAAAAILLVVVGVALAGSDGDDQVVTGTEPETSTTAAPSTTEASASSTTTEAATTTTEAPTTTTPPTTSPTTAPPTTAPPLPGGSTEPRSGPSSGPIPALHTDLRVACQGSTSRVVFEFADGAMPEWSVEYVDPPIIEDPTGDVVAVAGGAFLNVRMFPAWGNDFEQPDYPATYTGPTRLTGGCGGSLELVRTGAFEAVYSWAIGVPSRQPFTVTTLSSPARLVIDIAS